MPVSPDLGLEFSPFYLQQEAHEWRRPRVAVDGVEQEFPRRAMVNSLGYGGFYAGAIIEEYNSANGVPDSLDPGDCSGETQLVVLSAKTGERLKAAIRQLRSYVESRQQTRLRDVAYTLQVGREPMPYRWAAIVDSRKDLLHALDSCSDKEFPDLSTGSENLFAGFVNPVAAVLDGLLDPDAVEQILRRYVTEKNLAKLAAWWVKGADIPWDDLQREGSSRRIWLPTYPFGANGCQ